MTLLKFGEMQVISHSDFQPVETVMADEDVLRILEKSAAETRSVAPRANDFLYFTAIMMHSAEAALLNDQGEIRKDSSGNDVTARWEKNGDSWKWICSDINIRPTKNANGDIFPEEELIKAHKMWISKPLCLDHKSASVDMIRGLIVDTYYDRPKKRVVALCALDKKNYPDLADKVRTGYATSVSMGTAVGRAICFDCGKVARAEIDFCDHMRNKSCYGEINADLNPMELSIVVNGADPKAKIRHIVASANNIAKYLDMRETNMTNISKISQVNPVLDETGDIEKATKIEDGLVTIENKVKELMTEIEALKKHEEVEQAEHQKTPTESSKPKEEKGEANDGLYPTASSTQQDYIKLAQVIGELGQRLINLRETEESNMNLSKKGYHQGGGGVNEPQVYPLMGDNEKIRNTQDKQMTTPVATGSDGLFPGDAEKKKALQRIAEDKQAQKLRREAAVAKVKSSIEAKKAYHLGGGGVNEPVAIGKVQYAPMGDLEKIREKDDKQMSGASPFPGVGKVDGLYGDDEKTKKMLLRAKLTGKFVKAANPDGSDNLAESRWQVYADNKLILTATVNDLTNGRVDAFYEKVKSPDFGRQILGSLRSEGFNRTVAIFKGGQAAAMPAPAPDMAPPAGAPSMPAPDMAPIAEDAGGSGSPKDKLDESLQSAENAITDIREAVSELTNESPNELEGFGDLGGEVPPAMAKMLAQKVKLSADLLAGMKFVGRELNSQIKELKVAKDLLRTKEAQKDPLIKEMTIEACGDTAVLVSKAYQLMDSFVKYAKGTEILEKNAAQFKRSLQKKAQEQHLPGDPLDPSLDVYAPKASPMPVSPSAPVQKSPVKKLPSQMTHDELMAQRGNRGTLEHTLESNVSGNQGTPAGAKQVLQAPVGNVNIAPNVPQVAKADDGEDEDKNDAVKVDKDGGMSSDSPKEMGETLKAMKSAQFDSKTKEGRAMIRAKLAEKSEQFNKILQEGHPDGSPSITVDNKPSGNLGVIETLEDKHKAMLEVAKAPVKVRKMAEDIQKMVALGKIDPEVDFPRLVSKGLDSDAVKYWKSLYGQMKDGGSQFASDLVKQHAGLKASAEQEVYRVKLSRAYDLTYEMVRKGMCPENREAIGQQVNDFMSFNDEGFESMKRIVEKQAMVKSASISGLSVPQMGQTELMAQQQMFVPAATTEHSDLAQKFSRAFANRRY